MAFVVTIKGLYADAIKEVVEEITKKKLDDPKAVIVNNVPSFIDTVEGGANACGLMTVEEIVEI